jgi:glycosyltransferase involved in cell wall biosynthesis
MKTDLTFVIPAYNAESWLASSIGSCLAQSHRSIEVIVVNDASTDDSKHVIDWYAGKDERVRPIHLEVNKGSGNARNVACEAARAPIIAMLDADDESTANRAKDTLEAFKEKDCLFYGSFIQLDFLGRNLGTMLASKFDLEHSLKNKLNYICHSTMAFPKSFWEKNPYDTEEYVKSAMEDWKFQLEAYFSSLPLVHTEKVLAGFRIIDNGQLIRRDPKLALELKESFLKDHAQTV